MGYAVAWRHDLDLIPHAFQIVTEKLRANDGFYPQKVTHVVDAGLALNQHWVGFSWAMIC